MEFFNNIQDDHNIPKEEIQNSVLLDSNVIFGILDDFSSYNFNETLTQLKMAAFTCDYFLITSNTLKEIQFVISKKLIHTPNFQINLNKNLNLLSDYNNIRVLNKYDISEIQPAIEIQEKITSLKNIAINPRRSQLAIDNDLILLLTSNILTIPFLTEDRLLKEYYYPQFGKPVYNINIPFPFDSSYLKNISLNEIIALGRPFKKIYKKAFVDIKEKSKKIYYLQDDLKEREYVIIEQQNKLTEIIENLNKEKERSTLWKDFAKPRKGEAIIWTGIETAIAFSQIPIPTTPISYFIQTRRFKELEEFLKEK